MNVETRARAGAEPTHPLPLLPTPSLSHASPLLLPPHPPFLSTPPGFASSEVATAAPSALSPCDRLSVSPTNHI